MFRMLTQMVCSKLPYRRLPVTFNLSGNFGDEKRTSDISPPVILPLVHGGFPLLHSLHDLINMGPFWRLFAVSSLCCLLNLFNGLSGSGEASGKVLNQRHVDGEAAQWCGRLVERRQ